jgi:hypothetical protein
MCIYWLIWIQGFYNCTFCTDGFTIFPWVLRDTLWVPPYFLVWLATRLPILLHPKQRVLGWHGNGRVGRSTWGLKRSVTWTVAIPNLEVSKFGWYVALCFEYWDSPGAQSCRYFGGCYNPQLQLQLQFVWRQASLPLRTHRDWQMHSKVLKFIDLRLEDSDTQSYKCLSFQHSRRLTYRRASLRNL